MRCCRSRPLTLRVAALALRSDGKESEHIGFALSRLAHVAQASQFWISPGSRAQAASVPATMLGNARAPRTCASGPSQKRPDLASPPSQSDTSPSGYAPGRQSAPLHPLRSPPCRFDLPARSQRVGARAIARLQHRKPSGGRQPRSCNLRADCRRWKSSARLPRRNDTAHSVTADQRPEPADPRRNNLLRSADGMGDCSTRHGTTRVIFSCLSLCRRRNT